MKSEKTEKISSLKVIFTSLAFLILTVILIACQNPAYQEIEYLSESEISDILIEIPEDSADNNRSIPEEDPVYQISLELFGTSQDNETVQIISGLENVSPGEKVVIEAQGLTGGRQATVVITSLADEGINTVFLLNGNLRKIDFIMPEGDVSVEVIFGEKRGAGGEKDEKIEPFEPDFGEEG